MGFEINYEDPLHHELRRDQLHQSVADGRSSLRSSS